MMQGQQGNFPIPPQAKSPTAQIFSASPTNSPPGIIELDGVMGVDVLAGVITDGVALILAS